MFRNLRAEMAREGLKNKDIAIKLDISSKPFCNRMNGITEFTRSEMFRIQELFFKNSTLEYLFKWDDQEPLAPEKKDIQRTIVELVNFQKQLKSDEQ